MNSKILVTGATGTIGSFVVKGLQNKGVDFTALVRSKEKAKSFSEKGIKTVIGDFSDPDSLDNALEGIEKVFLLSATSPDSPKLQGTLVQKAKNKGVKHIVKLSSLGTSPHAKFGIPRYHAATEKDIKDAGIEYTFLHPHSFMQNFLFDSGTIKEQGVIYAPMGNGRIGLVDARDIAAVAVEALTGEGHEGQTYKITGPEAISYYDVAKSFSDALGKEIKYVDVDPDEAYKSMIEAGMPEWLVKDIVGLNKEFAAGNGSDLSNDVQNVTGSKPRSINQFIIDYIESFR